MENPYKEQIEKINQISLLVDESYMFGNLSEEEYQQLKAECKNSAFDVLFKAATSFTQKK